MPIEALDYRVEIIKARPQVISDFHLGDPVVGEIVDVTAHVELDGLGSINRAVERDLLSFKTGDVTITFDNPGGFFDDLFAFFGQTDMWGLRIYCKGVLHFWGVLIGVGSIDFDTKARSVEVTAYGLNKILDLTAADGGFDARWRGFQPYGSYTLNGTHSAGATSLTISPAASDFKSGDTVHITDHVKSEDVTVKRQTSSTVAELEAPLVNGYAGGTVIDVTTKFPRFRLVSYLAETLHEFSGFPLTDLRLSPSQFNRPAPVAVSIDRLAIPSYAAGANGGFTRGFVQKDGKHFVSVHSGAATPDTYSQDTPDGAWTLVDSLQGGWMDWSKYYVDGSAEPAVHLRNNFHAESDYQRWSGMHCAGYDFASSPNRRVFYIEDSAGTANLRFRTTADGTTWSGITSIANLPVDNGIGVSFTNSVHSVEYDPARDFVFVCWNGAAGKHFRYRDLGGAAWVDAKQGDDGASTGYFGACYNADLDVVLALRGDTATGPNFELCAFRGTTRLWKRPFPPVLIGDTPSLSAYYYPTRSMRYLNGILACVVMSDGEPQLVWSADEFQTYSMASIGPATQRGRAMMARVNGALRIAVFRGDVARGYLTAAPFFSGVIGYADFEGLSVAEGLKRLSIPVNAVFYLDDNGDGHFVARDLYDPGAVLDISDRVMERSDSIIWEETAQYVTVSGNGVEATAGDDSFAADGIELESPFVPNEAFAQALADSVYRFYSAKRAYLEITVLDTDGHIYYPLSRVTIDGVRYLVYESDHDLAGKEVALRLLEDV